jgi:hypothetical protein
MDKKYNDRQKRILKNAAYNVKEESVFNGREQKKA